MSNDSRVGRNADCKVCYLPHDDEIHAATLRIRHWLHCELTRKLREDSEPAPPFQAPAASVQVA